MLIFRKIVRTYLLMDGPLWILYWIDLSNFSQGIPRQFCQTDWCLCLKIPIDYVRNILNYQKLLINLFADIFPCLQ